MKISLIVALMIINLSGFDQNVLLHTGETEKAYFSQGIKYKM